MRKVFDNHAPMEYNDQGVDISQQYIVERSRG